MKKSIKKKYQSGGYMVNLNTVPTASSLIPPISTDGYRSDSPDRFNPFNMIPSGDITMKNVPHPVLGMDNKGNHKMMMPGSDYKFPGNYVMEVPFRQYGGAQHFNPEQGYYGPNKNLSDFYDRQSGVTNQIPGFSPTNPESVKAFQQLYDKLSNSGYFSGDGRTAVDGKFGDYTYGAPAIPAPVPQPKKSVSYEKIYDAQGNFQYSPVFNGNWSHGDSLNFMKDLPNDIGGHSVIKGQAYEELWNGRHQNTMAPQWVKTNTVPTASSVAKKSNIKVSYDDSYTAMAKGGYYMGMDGKKHKSKGSGTYQNGTYFKDGGHWIQNATEHMRKDHPCTGSKFGGPECPPGSKRYDLAKTFRHMHHKQDGGPVEQQGSPLTPSAAGPQGKKKGWADFANLGVDLFGISGPVAGYLQDLNGQQNLDKFTMSHGTTDSLFSGAKLDNGFSKGDYVNTGAAYGSFRPNRSVPGSAGMYYPAMQSGGYIPSELNYASPGIPNISQGAPSNPMSDNGNMTPTNYDTPAVPVPPPSDIATRTNNPGNMKYKPWMKKFGAQPSGIPGSDGGEFAAFPSLKEGLEAYKMQLFGATDGLFKSNYYKPDTPVDQALKTWSNGAYGSGIYPSIKDKTLGELTDAQRTELAKRQIKRESGKMFSELQQQHIFQQGGEYELTDEQIDQIKKAGGEVEYL